MGIAVSLWLENHTHSFSKEDTLTQLELQEKSLRGDLKLNGSDKKLNQPPRTPARLWAAWTLQGSEN